MTVPTSVNKPALAIVMLEPDGVFPVTFVFRRLSCAGPPATMNKAVFKIPPPTSNRVGHSRSAALGARAIPIANESSTHAEGEQLRVSLTLRPCSDRPGRNENSVARDRDRRIHRRRKTAVVHDPAGLTIERN